MAKGVERDIIQAITWYKRAMDAGDEAAKRYLLSLNDVDW